MSTCYAVLGIDRRASPDQIRSAYRKLAARFHPDRNPVEARRFLEINQAYLTLSDPEKRLGYDSTLPAKAGPTPGDQIEAAFKRWKECRWMPQDVFYREFSAWTKSRLRAEFSGSLVHFSVWRSSDMAAATFVETWIEPYDFDIRTEVLLDLELEADRDPASVCRTFFIDRRGRGAPRIMGKHRAVLAARRLCRVTVYDRLSNSV